MMIKKSDSRKRWIEIVNAFFDGTLMVDDELINHENEYICFHHPIEHYSILKFVPLSLEEIIEAMKTKKMFGDNYIIGVTVECNLYVIGDVELSLRIKSSRSDSYVIVPNRQACSDYKIGKLSKDN